MKVKKAILPIIGIYSVISASAAVFEPRSGELFQTTRNGPGEIALYQLVFGAFTFPIGLPLIITGGTCAIVDELVVFPVIDLVCLPYDLSQPRHGYFIRVTDDDGNPLEGVKFSVLSHDGAFLGRIDKVTDERGEIYVSRLAQSHYIDDVYMSKDGFYDSNSTVNWHAKRLSFRPSKAKPGEDGRIVWDLKLRKICHPVDMKKSTLKIPEELRRRKSCELFFDCEKGSWLPPHGSGVVADLKLEVRLSREPAEGERLGLYEPYQMALTAVRPDDGFIVRDIHPDGGFATDYVAPADGEYVHSPKDHPFVWGWNKEKRRFCFPENKYCIMRLRTEKADDGTIGKAHYGKLFLYDGRPRSYFTLQPNELSIEEKQER